MSLILEKIRNGTRVEYFESVRVTKDGRRLNVSVSVSPIHDPDGRVMGASAIARNITAQKKIEDQLRHSQKMEAVGAFGGRSSPRLQQRARHRDRVQRTAAHAHR